MNIIPELVRSHFYQKTDIQQSTTCGYFFTILFFIITHKSGANTTKACACGITINDVHHFLLECRTYSLARQYLITSVTDIWNNSDETGKIVISAPLLLASTAHSRLTAAECNDILLASFHFIRLSGLNL